MNTYLLTQRRRRFRHAKLFLNLPTIIQFEKEWNRTRLFFNRTYFPFHKDLFLLHLTSSFYWVPIDRSLSHHQLRRESNDDVGPGIQKIIAAKGASSSLDLLFWRSLKDDQSHFLIATINLKEEGKKEGTFWSLSWPSYRQWQDYFTSSNIAQVILHQIRTSLLQSNSHASLRSHFLTWYLFSSCKI